MRFPALGGDKGLKASHWPASQVGLPEPGREGGKLYNKRMISPFQTKTGCPRGRASGRPSPCRWKWSQEIALKEKRYDFSVPYARSFPGKRDKRAIEKCTSLLLPSSDGMLGFGKGTEMLGDEFFFI